jgi:transposase
MALTVCVEVPPRDREVLASWVRSTSIRVGLAQRARIVLLAGDGAGTNEIVRRTGASKPTVILWKKRYAAEGTGGLEDRPRPGRARWTDDVAIVLATLEPPPARLGVTHWSSRLLAAELGVSNVKVAEVWREWGLQPWRAESFKFSTDPQLEARVRDVTGLYLNPPDKAVVLCVDEKPQTQALERKAPVLPLRPGGAGEAQSRLHPARQHRAVRRAGGRHRQGDRRLLPPAPARGVPGLPPAGREGLSPGAAAHRVR